MTLLIKNGLLPFFSVRASEHSLAQHPGLDTYLKSLHKSRRVKRPSPTGRRTDANSRWGRGSAIDEMIGRRRGPHQPALLHSIVYR